ncbi:protein-disulfide reductase DsbD family protein [Microbulbifer bruguierae]|uniref:Protein-disulfide reductase DsbD family protein n=1 Tax=Microbulbifer bruguierae TaxID=3029061 RepID=A0ABY8NCX5_9GAMM|nr:protein-disulfide reductase DsbD domain-containing protein [Microbulbifer bruguierae]WGL16555.1 protein-disulfide reductase DsbD family protein [Microbulbifer bruguierae]
MLWLTAVFAAVAQAQDSTSGDHVQVRWLAPEQFGQTSETIGFYFEVDPGWHVYWRNAGDSGAAPRFAITATSADVGDIQWPFPVRLPIAHLTNLGYEGDVAYLFDVTPAADLVQLQVNLEWLVCKEDCIPGFGTMTLERPRGDSAKWSSADRALRDRFLSRVPKAASQSPWRIAGLQRDGEQVNLALESSSGAQEPPEVFPMDGALLTAAAPEIFPDGKYVAYSFVRVPGAPAANTTGFVVASGGEAWQFDDVAIDAVPDSPDQDSVTATTFEKPAAAPPQPLWLLLLAAIAGGAILNLMPCVFPVLSIKLFGLMGPGTSTQERLKAGFLYGAGVLVTFALLGGLLLILRAGGAAIGWGFQLQSAPVVLALIVLFWLMALSFSGVYEFGHRLMNLAGHSRAGSFATGVLAVFVAAPCTGPFMGAALGAATLLPAISAMAIFVGLGLGLALPFVLLCLFPALLRRLPQPGPWMETLRQFLAFPLYATVIWLLWVLGRLVGDDGWLLGALVLLAVVFALWLAQHLHRFGKLFAWCAVLAVIVMGLFAANSLQDRPAPAASAVAGEGWQPYDKAAIDGALARGQGVFIDYTAAWCITCQVNKKLVLDTDEITALFASNDVYLVRADWTDQDPAITAALSALGRNSVPVYAWYAPGRKTPVLLPQILQASMIEALFAGESGSQH